MSFMRKFIIFLSLFKIIFNDNIKTIPVIAIYGLPSSPESSETLTDKVQEWYVRWIEASGGRSLVIHMWHTDKEIDEILNKANGILFQGGARYFNLNSTWEERAKYIINKIIYLNQTKKNHLPLLGICLGMELIIASITRSISIFDTFDSENISLPLVLEGDMRSSRIFSLFNFEDFTFLKGNNTVNNHFRGITRKVFNNIPEIWKEYKISSFSYDRNGKEFISSIEHNILPIFMLQFHPEKVPFDRSNNDDIPRNLESLRITHNLGNFFISEAQKNNQTFISEDELNYHFIDTFHLDKQILKKHYYWYQFKESFLKN
jgi:hypothetical protein